MNHKENVNYRKAKCCGTCKYCVSDYDGGFAICLKDPDGAEALRKKESDIYEEWIDWDKDFDTYSEMYVCDKFKWR